VGDALVTARLALLMGCIAFTAAVGVGSASAGSLTVSAYGGWNGSFNSDVNFTGPGTDWTVKNIPWEGLSVGGGDAPYYGVRVTYWSVLVPNLGIALDYTHAKVRANPAASVSYSGPLGGPSFNGTNTIGNLFGALRFTNGLNLVTLNALYRLRSIGMLHPYVGAGLGISIPEVEVTGNGSTVNFARTFAYEYGGPAAQGIAGIDLTLTKRISVFTEYKLSWTSVNSPITGGDRIHTTIVTNHLLAGLTLQLW
jgi:lipid A oxidase